MNNTVYKNNKNLLNKLPTLKINQRKEINHVKIKSVPRSEMQNNSYQRVKGEHYNGMLVKDAIRNKIKKRINDNNYKPLDFHSYNGLINITCISCKNYEETVDNLIKKVKKNGYKIVRNGNNCFEFSNGKNNFLVEIVIIRNNMFIT